MSPSDPAPQLDFTYRDIQGWFNFEDIYEQAVERSPDHGLFVEVGSWRGMSTAFLAAEIARSGKKIEFNAVDTWRGSQEEYHQQVVSAVGGDLFPEFWSNMQKAGVAHRICPLQMHSADAALRFADESVDFCYIDASHDFLSVRNDIRSWLPKIKWGGVLAGHDVDRLEVMSAVQDAIPWSEVEISRSSWRWTKGACCRGDWKRPLELSYVLPSHMVCIPCVTTVRLLERALESISEAHGNVAVFDTSAEGLDLDRAPWAAQVSIYETNEQPSFTQAMNLMLHQCQRAGVRWCVFMHADAACRDRHVLRDLLDRAERLNAAHRLGVLFSNYDAFCAFNMEAIADVGPWDETFDWYCSDVDYYHRLRLRGWRVEQSPRLASRVLHDVSGSINSNAVLAQRVAEHFSHRHAHLDHKWQGAKVIPYQPHSP